MVVAACEVLHKEKGAMCAAVRRGSRVAGAAHVALCAQQHHSCTMVLCTRRLWMRARAGASALAAMYEDAGAYADVVADGNADDPPFSWPSQPDHSGHHHRQRGNGVDQHVGSRNRREDSAAGYVGRCRRSGSWRSGGGAVPPPAVTHGSGSDASQAPRQRVGDKCRRRLMSMLS